MTRAAVVIPVYNRITVLERTLAALETQDHDDLVVVVADDGSDEDIAGLVDRWSPRFQKVYVRQEHDGFGAARARNLGARSVEADVVVFLDSDGITPADYVSRHVSHHVAHPRAVVIGRRVHLIGAELDPIELARGIDLTRLPQEPRGDFRTILARRTSRLRRTDEGYRAFVSSNVSMRMSLFEETGGFDERFRWWGSEDTEFGWRLWQAGTEFIDDPSNVIYHQLDADTSEGAEGRQRARELNRGLLSSLIPHRFYRKGVPNPAPEVPKFTILVHDVPQGSPPEIWAALEEQTEPDFEVVYLADGRDHDPFAGAASGERRIRFQPDPVKAIEESRAEFLVFIGGHAAPRNSLLQNVRVRLERRPATPALTFGITTPGGPHGRPSDLAHLTEAWEYRLPTALAVRRRPLIQALAAGRQLDEALDELAAQAQHTRQPLISLPANSRANRPESFAYTTTRVAPRARSIEEAREEAVERPGIRYVGWVGKDNLGDEAMLQAVTRIMPWGEVSTRGEATDLLLLGGGTLINRNQYLGWLAERDSPRIERAVFGTGVASPSYWGITEDIEEWKRWLDTCCYVGVRGPRSAQTLTDWGYTGEVEICGDPALALRRPDIGVEEGSVLIAPVWTGGELWGESDQKVCEELAAATAAFLSEGRKVTLLSCHPTDDRPILMIREMAGPGTHYFCGYEDVDESMRAIASAAVVIGERLHACVLAAAAGRPFVALEYRPKVRDFAASVEMEGFVLRTDEVDGPRLVAVTLEAERADLTRMNKSVEGYRSLLERASRLIHSAVQQ
ncbi:MAG TPA: glycosyltransferase [Acidimicrobiia bacterium]